MLRHLTVYESKLQLALSLFVLLASVPAAAFGQSSEIRFNRDVRPILSNNCFHCHGPGENSREADLRLDIAEAAYEDRGGYFAIVPGSIEKSDAWYRITTDDEDLVMPPPDSHKELTADEKAVLKAWIEQGAKFEGHWAFIAPQKAALPEVDHPRFTTQPIDRFIARRLAESDLEPSPRAAKEILLRRVTLDLTGLPPTIAEIDAFLNDSEPGAYERVVDRLLKSPRFGEHMAVHWLDAARYGDTSVFHADGPRDMWVWRDWVVESFNSNLPFDEFTIHQLAGDQLPDATWRELVATGFNRNNATTDEGGAIAEEFRVEYAVDRVKTTSMVWLGLSMECAQCHEHKYDPISQEDYYRFFAFFNQASDPGMQTRGGNQAPIVDVPDLEDEKRIPVVEAEIEAAKKRLDQLASESNEAYAKWLAEAESKSDDVAAPADAVSHLALDRVEDKKLFDELNPETFGKLEGKAKLVDGKFLTGLRTSGDSYASFADTGDFERDQPFTYAAWIHSGGAINGSPVARMDVAGGHRGYDMLLSNKEIEVHLIHSWPDNAIKVEAATQFKKGEWHHVCVTYDGSSKAAGVTIYHNGKKIEHKTEVDKLSETIRTESPLLLGRRSQGAVFNGTVDDVRFYSRALNADEVGRLALMDAITPLLKLAAESRTDQQKQQLKQHFLTTQHQPYMETLASKADMEKQLVELRKPLSTVMVMKDIAEPRMTFVLERGQYDGANEDRPVEPGTPGMLPPLEAQGRANRLALARWITSDENPLTARVAVNRYWQMIFGTGIVKTAEEFGSQGEWPSHPALLDWLAVDFVEHGWDVKRLLKQMVMSETYQQSSRTTPELYAADPGNRLLARGPRYRLSAEMVRDQALFCGGLLVDSMGGPSVKPYQPPGLWSEVSLNPGVKFVQDKGEKLYRRSLYTYWKRSSPPPMMLIFDAPSREKCSIRRSNTNTPLQALVLLNDPQFLEASRAMAQRLLLAADATDEQRVELAYRWVTARKPSDKVMDALLSQLDRQRQRYEANEEAARQLLSHGESSRDETIAISEHAAWMIVCSILLNLDETVTRG